MGTDVGVFRATCAAILLFSAQELRAHRDAPFDETYDARLSPGSRISALALQPDGKLIVAGEFGFEHRSHRFSLARLEKNGVIDTGFQSPPFVRVSAVALQNDGKIVVSGKLPTAAGATNFSGGIVRLLPNGAVDEAFNSQAAVGDVTPGAIAVQPIGRTNFVIVADALLNKSWPRAIRRLLPDGSLDRSFTTNGCLSLGPNGFVSKIYVQSNSKILIGGSFNGFGGVPRKSIMRLNHNGSLDKFFDPGASLWSSYGLNGATGTIVDILYDPPRSAAGTIYVAAQGVRTGGEAVSFVADLDGATGVLEFRPSLETTNGRIFKLAAFASDVLAGGAFTTMRRLGQTVTNLSAVDGSIDLVSTIFPRLLSITSRQVTVVTSTSEVPSFRRRSFHEMHWLGFTGRP